MIEVNYGESGNYKVQRIFNGGIDLVGLSFFDSEDQPSEITYRLGEGEFHQEIHLLPSDDNYPRSAEGLIVEFERTFKAAALDVPDESKRYVSEIFNHYLDGAFVGRTKRRFNEDGFLVQSTVFDEKNKDYIFKQLVLRQHSQMEMLKKLLMKYHWWCPTLAMKGRWQRYLILGKLQTYRVT